MSTDVLSYSEDTSPTGLCTVSMEEGLRPDDIAPIWRGLECRSSPSFFLSWSWVGVWLRQAGGTADLLVARRDSQVVGLALLRRATGRRRFLARPLYHLTTAGDDEMDCVFIEYNGFLAAAQDLPEVAQAFFTFLAGRRMRLRLPGVDAALLTEALASRLVARIEISRPSPFVDLTALRQSGSAYLAGLSSNCRRQIRRSMRLFEADGPLRLTPAGSLAEAQSFLAALAELHQRRWRARRQMGAFARTFFGDFHHRLIAENWQAGHIDLLQLRAGDREIGYLYNFLYGGRAWAYQSGFDYGPDARLKPGLVSHALAVERYLSMGLDRYLLLAGGGRYKESLANGSEYLHWLILRPPDWSGAYSDWVHRLYARIERRRQGRDVATDVIGIN